MQVNLLNKITFNSTFSNNSWACYSKLRCRFSNHGMISQIKLSIFNGVYLRIALIWMLTTQLWPSSRRSHQTTQLLTRVTVAHLACCRIPNALVPIRFLSSYLYHSVLKPFWLSSNSTETKSGFFYQYHSSNRADQSATAVKLKRSPPLRPCFPYDLAGVR